MALRRAVVGGLVGWGRATAGLAALGASGCGGTSVQHVSDGGTGGGGTGGSHGGTGGTGQGGAGQGGTGSHGTPCATVGSFAGPEFVAWNVSPDSSCEGMEIFCYEPSDAALSTCLDPEPGGPSGDASPPAPSTTPGCPNVRIVCNTQIGCCESTYTLIAGPERAETPPCCYLAQPGFHPR
ncbi:MAG TPA: hypothetical protein VFV94_12090 [Polyangiaceae bacterium]|nr:hypothetical protein [Polyangiaceae bacterium]